MVAKFSSKYQKLAMNGKAKAKPKTATASKVKQGTRLKSDKPSAKIQEDSKSIQAKLKHQTQLKRVSFIVRLTVDELGQPQRTEIEQVENGRKQNFLDFDGESLVAFMMAEIRPNLISKNVFLKPPAQKEISPMPWPPGSKSNLVIFGVQVFHREKPRLTTLILTSQDPFVVQAHFQIQGIDADSVTIQEPLYKMSVYVNEVTSGKCGWLTTYTARLIRDELDYVASADIPKLSPGLYRLFTVVTLESINGMGAFYSNTIIRVI